jgi:hypothetical protein
MANQSDNPIGPLTTALCFVEANSLLKRNSLLIFVANTILIQPPPSTIKSRGRQSRNQPMATDRN